MEKKLSLGFSFTKKRWEMKIKIKKILMKNCSALSSSAALLQLMLNIFFRNSKSCSK